MYQSLSALVIACFIELRVQQGIDILRRDAQNCLFFCDQAFVCHIHGDLHSGLGGALAIAGLKHPQFAALDRELDILHILVMLFELGGDVHELLVSLGHLSPQDAQWGRHYECLPPHLHPGH